MFDRARLLVLGAGLYQLAGIRRAVGLGCEVITVDNVPLNPGHGLAASSLNVSTTDVEGVVEAARTLAVDGVVTFASDVATEAVAACVHELGLPGPEPAVVNRMSNKAVFRSLQRHADLPHPEFVVTPDSTAVLEFAESVGWSVVVKPTDSSGSRGVALVNGEGAPSLALAIDDALQSSRSREVIVEAVIPGTVVSGDAHVSAGEVSAFFPTVKHSRGFVATGHSYPSEVSGSVHDEIGRQIGAACRAAGYVNGVLDFDVMVNGEDVTLIEMSPRSGGNGIPELIERSYGYPMLTMAVASALGNRVGPPLRDSVTPSGSLIFGSSQGGTIRDIATASQILDKAPEVFAVELVVATGDRIERFEHGGASIGYALFDIDESYSRSALGVESALGLAVL